MALFPQHHTVGLTCASNWPCFKMSLYPLACWSILSLLSGPYSLCLVFNSSTIVPGPLVQLLMTLFPGPCSFPGLLVQLLMTLFPGPCIPSCYSLKRIVSLASCSVTYYSSIWIQNAQGLSDSQRWASAPFSFLRRPFALRAIALFYEKIKRTLAIVLFALSLASLPLLKKG